MRWQRRGGFHRAGGVIDKGDVDGDDFRGADHDQLDDQHHDEHHDQPSRDHHHDIIDGPGP
jgi:hypothetical protein